MKRLIPALLVIPLLALSAAAAHADAAAKTSSAAQPPLDLRAPNFSSPQWQERLQGPTLDNSEYVVTEAVVVPSPEGNSNVRIANGGFGALLWAFIHPVRAWRILLPVQSGDQFDADTGIRLAFLDTQSECPGFVGTPNVRPICP